MKNKIVQDILVANFFIKAGVPILGLALLAAMCSIPNNSSHKNKALQTPNQELCNQAAKAYENNSGRTYWTAQEIACKNYTSNTTLNPNIYQAKCTNAVKLFLSGKATDLDAECWPEKVAAVKADPNGCPALFEKLLDVEYLGGGEYVSFGRSEKYFKYQEQARDLMDQMDTKNCAQNPGRLRF